MKVAFFSSDPISLPSIRYLQAEHELVCIVSNPDRPKGRGKKVSPNEVSQWAIDNSVDLLRPEGKPSDDDVAHLREVGAELLIVMAYGCILKKNILEYGKYPCLNLHASLLPELRGASPIETAIALGKTRTGVSLMRVEPAMDTGAVADAEEGLAVGLLNGLLGQLLQSHALGLLDDLLGGRQLSGAVGRGGSGAPRLGGSAPTAAAGGQGQGKGSGEQQCKCAFHNRSSFVILHKIESADRRSAGKFIVSGFPAKE